MSLTPAWLERVPERSLAILDLAADLEAHEHRFCNLSGDVAGLSDTTALVMPLTAWTDASWTRALSPTEGDLAAITREFALLVSESEQWRFELMGLSVARPRYSPNECARLAFDHSGVLKGTLRVVFLDPDGSITDIREQEVYLGELPLPTAQGTLMIEGLSRWVRAELAPCEGLAPTARGWRWGNRWGDSLAFVPVEGGVELSVRLAQDSLASAWTHEPAALVEERRVSTKAKTKGKAKTVTVLKEPLLPSPTVLRDRADLEAFCRQIKLPRGDRVLGAPSDLLANVGDASWQPDDLARVLSWVQTDEATSAARALGTPLRVLGPGQVLMRWVRRGLFLTLQNAIARGDTIMFGSRSRPSRAPELSWMPADTVNSRPLGALLRERVLSASHAPMCPLGQPLTFARITRSVRVSECVEVPANWLTDTADKVTQLALCELTPEGLILAPHRFAQPSLSTALALGGEPVCEAPLPLVGAQPAPLESTLAASIAQASGAVRVWPRDTTVLVATPNAIAIACDLPDRSRWIEARAADEFDREALCVGPGDSRRGAVFAQSLLARESTLALGCTARVGYDRRVPEGAIWISTASLGTALNVRRAERRESQISDTRWGREAWIPRGRLGTLADVGDRVRPGESLATVSVPMKDESISPEELLLRAIDGASPRAALSRERATLWREATATVIARWTRVRFGADDVPEATDDRVRARAELDARALACEALDESVREPLVEAIARAREQLSRGDELPPGVIAIAQWLLEWTAPLVAESSLVTRTGHRWRVAKITERALDSQGLVCDALLHPSAQALVDTEALVTGYALAKRAPVLLAPDEALAAAFARLKLEAIPSAPRALYLLRER